MTASASVVEALRGAVSTMIEQRDRFKRYGKSHAELDLAISDAELALNAPHPAEQDAREAVAWNRCDSTNQVMLYTLRQDGWRKGQPVMVNDVMVTVQKANASESDIEPVAATVLSALTRAAPDGWVLVPVEPMPEMVAAWYRVKNGHHFHDEPAPTDTSDYAAYRAMLSASPAPPAQGAGG